MVTVRHGEEFEMASWSHTIGLCLNDIHQGLRDRIKLMSITKMEGIL